MSLAEQITRAFGGDWHGDWGTIPTPGHSTKDRGTTVRDADGGDVVFNSFNGADWRELKDECRRRGLLPAKHLNGATQWRVTGEYLFRDENGAVLYRTRRHQREGEAKRFTVEHRAGDAWVSGIGKARRVLYRLPELLAADPAEIVYLLEGEKLADLVASWGLVATAVAFGCKGWRKQYAEALAGRTVAILPDNDEPGRAFADTARAAIDAAGGRALIVELPGLPPKGDVIDWGGTVDELRNLAGAAGAPALPAYKRGITAAALMEKQFDPVNLVIPGLLAEGAWILAGPPKLGKSWLCLDFGLALASGRPVFGTIPVRQGDVLYLPLEDSERRLKSRLLKKGIRNAPERLTLATEWPGLDDGCIAELEAWADAVEHPSLIIIDVLKMVRGVTRANETVYDADYRALTGLASFARRRGIAVLIVHHTRKMAADDPLESISGTNGLTGAADGVMVLKRDIGTGNCLLYVRGRDIEESETAIRFQRDIGTWQRLGAADEVGRTTEREAILSTLRASPKPLTAREISDILGKNYDAIRKTLARMAHAGEIGKEGRGLYACPKCSNVSGNAAGLPDWDIETVGTAGESSIARDEDCPF
jgi:hypothetical protein